MLTIFAASAMRLVPPGIRVPGDREGTADRNNSRQSTAMLSDPNHAAELSKCRFPLVTRLCVSSLTTRVVRNSPCRRPQDRTLHVGVTDPTSCRCEDQPW
jgi:hypothetical protein